MRGYDFETKLLGALLIIVGTIFLIMVTFIMGVAYERAKIQEEIEQRAMELPDPGYETDCYTWDDIEYVVFGESQE